MPILRYHTSSLRESPRLFYDVSFRTPDGLQNEARLLNPKGFLEVGSRLRIRYLPEKDCFAVMAEAAVS